MPLDPADAGRLRDMVEYAEEAITLLGALDSDQLRQDCRTFLAVTRCVEIVGEAAWKLSDAIKATRSQIPWLLIAGMASSRTF